MIDVTKIGHAMPWYRRLEVDRGPSRLALDGIQSVPIAEASSGGVPWARHSSHEERLIRNRDLNEMLLQFSKEIRISLRLQTEPLASSGDGDSGTSLVSLDLPYLRRSFPGLARFACDAERLYWSEEPLENFYDLGLKLTLGAYEVLFALADDPNLDRSFPIARQRTRPHACSGQDVKHFIYGGTPESMGLSSADGLTENHIEWATHSLASLLGVFLCDLVPLAPSTCFTPGLDRMGLGVESAMRLYFSMNPSFLSEELAVFGAKLNPRTVNEGGRSGREWVLSAF